MSIGHALTSYVRKERRSANKSELQTADIAAFSRGKDFIPTFYLDP